MASRPAKASAKSLSSMLLLGEYNSDSDHDEKAAPCTPGKRPKSDVLQQTQQTRVAVNAFVSELNQTLRMPVGATSWTKCMDENTGHPYYWNTDTKEVTWEVPSDYQAYLDQNASVLRDPRVANMWTKYFSEDTPPNVYYVNELTRIVSWNKPIGFVDAETAVAKVEAVSDEPQAKKNIIKRRKPSKTKTANPFSDTKDLDSEKIELITTFAAKSDSSSDEEKHRNGSPVGGTAQLKLVATDYNSDDNASPDDPSYAAAIVKPRPSQKKPTKPLLELPTSEGHISKRPKTSFASIITGGRSPEHVIEPVNEPPSTTEDHSADKDVVAPFVKMQKRKRRIEFITKAPDTSIAENDLVEQTVFTCQAPPHSVDAIDTNTLVQSADHTPSNANYSNFQKSTDELETHTVPLDGDSAVAQIEMHKVREVNENDLHNAEVLELKETIGAKLKFLCDGRPEIPAVQAITIQLETLLEAFDDGALQATYMLKWLAGIASDLQTLEADAAPAGWKCLWNRSNGKYCYKHLESGSVRWEYPENEDNEGEGSNSEDSRGHGQKNAVDDEMDICTTPPPNANEQLLSTTEGSSKSKKCSTKPITTSKSLDHADIPTANNISLELASFYSDIAAIDSTTTTSVETDSTPAHIDTPPPPPPPVLNATPTMAPSDEMVAKKKKRKIQKLTPWRSGNLETWINKWQKAQQEMDN